MGCLDIGIEVSTVAIACIYFERLCIKSLITKTNRRLSIAVCLLLAFKFNEPITGPSFMTRLEELLHFIDREYQISKIQLFNAEFGALVHLNFSLNVPYMHVLEMFKRLPKKIHLKKINHLLYICNSYFLNLN